jgi:hypothetical protein
MIASSSSQKDSNNARDASQLANRRGEQLANIGIWIVIAYTAVTNVVAAARRPFWYDELCTVIVAGQPTLGKLLYAYRQAEDSAPLVYVFVEHIWTAIIPNAEIAYRAASILAFACSIWCLFVFIRTRSGAGIALVSAVLPIFTQFYSVYAVEARSYEIVVACVAIGMVCYQRAGQGRWTVAFAASLFAAGAFHYYGFFAVVPFLCAELVFAVEIRAVRWRVWLAILSGFIPVAASYPRLHQMKNFYGTHFWGRATWSMVGLMYGRVRYEAVLIATGVLAIMCVFTIFVPVWRAGKNRPEVSSAREHILALLMLGLPIIEYVGLRISNGPLTKRYALVLVLGGSIAVSYTLRFLGRRFVLPACIVLLVLLTRHEVIRWKAMPWNPPAVSASDSFEKLANAAGHADLAIVVSNGQAYLPLVYYDVRTSPKRIVSLVDPAAAVMYAGSDSVDRQLSALSCCFALQVYDFYRFASDHPSFLLYSNSGDFDWWPRRLAADKYDLRLLTADRDRRVFLVSRSGL